MSKSPKPVIDADPRLYLTALKFPEGIRRQMGSMPGGGSHPDPQEPSFWSRDLLTLKFVKTVKRSDLVDDAKGYLDELDDLSDDEVSQLITEAEEQRLNFNAQGSAADWHYWCKMAEWTVEEGVALSLGRDPRQVSWATVEPAVVSSPFARAYRDRRDIFLRAQTAGVLQENNPPVAIVEWMRRIEIEVPPELAEAATKYNSGTGPACQVEGVTLTTEETQNPLVTKLRREVERLEEQLKEAKAGHQQAKGLDPREHNSLHLLVNAMAREKYRFDPKDTLSSVTSNIVSAVERQGNSISSATALKHLRAASETAARLRNSD